MLHRPPVQPYLALSCPRCWCTWSGQAWAEVRGSARVRNITHVGSHLCLHPRPSWPALHLKPIMPLYTYLSLSFSWKSHLSPFLVAGISFDFLANWSEIPFNLSFSPCAFESPCMSSEPACLVTMAYTTPGDPIVSVPYGRLRWTKHVRRFLFTENQLGMDTQAQDGTSVMLRLLILLSFCFNVLFGSITIALFFTISLPMRFSVFERVSRVIGEGHFASVSFLHCEPCFPFSRG